MRILNQYGKPAQLAPKGTTLYADSQTGGYRQTRPQYDDDYGRLMNRAAFRAMLSDGRGIHAQYSLVSAASRQKSTYVSSSGWHPVFIGQDRDFGDKLLSALRPALARNTNKGFSFGKTQQMASRYFDIDGGFFKLLATHPATGFPVTQIIEAHRVANRTNQHEVADGRFKGKRIQNGVIYSADGAEIAYQILGATVEFDRIVEASTLIHCADWQFHSENRPWGAIAYGMLDFYDSKEFRHYQKIKNKSHAALTVIEHTATGFNLNGAPEPGGTDETATQSSGGLRTESVEAGMFRYLKANSGQKLEPFESRSPSSETQTFDARIIASAMLGMGWAIEMLDLSSLTGAGFRGFANIINKTIRDRWNLVNHYARQELLYKVSALQARGDIPEHEEWDALEFPHPSEFDVDPGHTQKLDEANARIGRTSIPRLIRKDGNDPKLIMEENAQWLEMRDRLARERGINAQELGTLSKPGDAFIDSEPPPEE